MNDSNIRTNIEYCFTCNEEFKKGDIITDIGKAKFCMRCSNDAMNGEIYEKD